LKPACATACPTESIVFGEIGELRVKAAERLETLRARGIGDAMLYDAAHTSVGGTHAMFIFRGRPEDYNLPSAPEVPTVHLKRGWTAALVAAALMALGSAAAFASSRDE
jgi:formate dehydrogenase iron-sulfur subunit